MTDTDDWETIGRETAYCVLWTLVDDAEAAIDHVSSPVLWNHDVSAEDVERMRALAFKVKYVTETYLARLCEETEPWEAGDNRQHQHQRPDPLPDVTDADREEQSDGE